jgi:hypothetical protein
LETKQSVGIYHISKSIPEIWCVPSLGTLVNMGLHKITLDDFNNIIEARIETRLVSVPAHGLYLTEIDYDYITK